MLGYVNSTKIPKADDREKIVVKKNELIPTSTQYKSLEELPKNYTQKKSKRGELPTNYPQNYPHEKSLEIVEKWSYTLSYPHCPQKYVWMNVIYIIWERTKVLYICSKRVFFEEKSGKKSGVSKVNFLTIPT